MSYPAFTNSLEFKAWFGDSKVVDADGKPRVMYHGTNRDFNTFNGAAYFSPSPEVASDHAEWRVGEDEGGEANVRPVYLSIKNPIALDDPSALAYEFGEIEKLQAQGYDGAISSDGEEFIAFKPEQIKSAIGNRIIVRRQLRAPPPVEPPAEPLQTSQDAGEKPMPSPLRQAVSEMDAHYAELRKVSRFSDGATIVYYIGVFLYLAAVVYGLFVTVTS